MKHALNRWRWDGSSNRAVSVVDGAPTSMLCGAGKDTKHTELEPDCPRCRRALGLNVPQLSLFGDY